MAPRWQGEHVPPLSKGSRFWYQHGARLHPGGLVTVFHNGSNGSPSPEPATRALVLRLDLMIGWGTAPYVSVVSPSGVVRYDATLPSGDSSYRVVLHPWTGAPTTCPSVAVVRAVAGAGATVSMSWDGATGVARWQVWSGRSPAGLRRVAVAASHGFETTARLAEADKLVQVVALGAIGAPLGRSALVGP